MAPMEHIWHRHGPHSAFPASEVGQFANGTRTRDIKSMIQEAVDNGTAIFDAKGGALFYDFKRQIGTGLGGVPATRIKVTFNKLGEITTAYPIE